MVMTLSELLREIDNDPNATDRERMMAQKIEALQDELQEVQAREEAL